MSVEERLARIEHLLETLIEQRTVKDWYSTGEAIRIRMEDLMAFIESQKAQPPIPTNASKLQHIMLPSSG